MMTQRERNGLFWTGWGTCGVAVALSILTHDPLTFLLGGVGIFAVWKAMS